jgi:predicted RNA-binding protein with PIN domain
MPSGRVWLIDGQNVIFAIPGLEALQTSGRGDEARDILIVGSS